MNEELKEEWKEYNGYKVSNYGKVINKKGKYLKSEPNKDGYVHTSIKGIDGKRIHGMHRIVAIVFLDNIDNLPEVNHKDGIKGNNRVDNLEWCTKKENQQHEVRVLKQRNGEKNCKNKLTTEQVIEIYDLCKEGDMKYKDISKLYGVIPEQIHRIARGVNWKDLNLEPLPTLTRGARGRSKKVLWINQNKEYSSMTKCSDDLRNTYNIIIDNKIISDICKGNLDEYKEQKFKWVS